MRFAFVFVALMTAFVASIRYGQPVWRLLDDKSNGKRLAGVFAVGALCVVFYIGVPALVLGLTGDGFIPLSPARAIPATDVLRNLPATAMTFGFAAVGIRIAHDFGLKLLTAFETRRSR
jgi:hypothetical protein